MSLNCSLISKENTMSMFEKKMYGVMAAVMVVVMFATVSNAENLSVSTDEETQEVYIHFEGDYTQGSGKRLWDLARRTKATYVSFDSGGGVAREGSTVAWIMNELNLVALVRHQSKCMSACAVSVLGANERFIDGIVGFHNAYMPEDTMSGPDGFQAGQIEGTTSTFFMLDKGVSRQVIRAMVYLTSPDVFMVFTSTESFNRMFTGEMTAEELVAAMWSVQDISIYEYMAKRKGNLND
jgi:hypothetical protein